jgi:hypothetical protein
VLILKNSSAKKGGPDLEVLIPVMQERIVSILNYNYIFFVKAKSSVDQVIVKSHSPDIANELNREIE